jgi:hypothetical protein
MVLQRQTYWDGRKVLWSGWRDLLTKLRLCWTGVHSKNHEKGEFLFTADCQDRDGKTNTTWGTQTSEGKEDTQSGCAICAPIRLDWKRKMLDLTGVQPQSKPCMGWARLGWECPGFSGARKRLDTPRGDQQKLDYFWAYPALYKISVWGQPVYSGQI